MAAHFEGCRVAARVDADVDNEENGGPIHACRRVRGSWREQWPILRHLG
jgi:hypothetical protein